ncbi:serine acetyltransferase [Parabacteroides sp. PF5-9]|uniref:serine O-acetyltransferase n=1 Tax=Parabacteroides sp. PF5-9 TaxID=1742404 RepID=UPI002475E26E|nr:serine acetyltransferase [Parabacteroides sp. PF5-9]MDH6356459.1 serine O-acetyltransferase [Parabacteroides sp. PF5-9]
MDRSDILHQIQKNAEILSAVDKAEYTHIPLHQKPSPSVHSLQEIMHLLRKIIFPGFFGTEQESQVSSIRYYMGVNLENLYDLLYEQIYNGLCFEREIQCPDSKGKASEIALTFINEIPRIKALLSTDVKAILDGDPAATSPSEVIFSYPGLLAIFHQRVAHELLLLDVPIIPRIITEMAHANTGIDIHPGAQIGEYFAIDHGTGIVIGETTIIGNHVKIYQGVTLGAKSFTYDDQGLPVNNLRHPIIEDHVIIYSNTSILGRITIGEGSVIGGNIWLTQSVAPHSKVLQSQVQKGK